MLTPGEFVIKKSSAQKLGAQKLGEMNSPQRFAEGGKAKKEKVPKVVPAGGATQASHIGADLKMTRKMVDVAMTKATIKFKRSFVANAIFGGHAGMSKAQKATLQNNADVNKLFKQNIGMNSSKIITSMGLTAKTPLKLNYPKTWNQALRTGNIDLVNREAMSNWTATAPNLFGGKGLPKKIQSDPNFQANLKGIQAGLATAIKGIPGSAMQGKAFDHDAELQPLKGHLIKALDAVSPKAIEAMMKRADFMFSGSGWVTRKGVKRTSGDRDENRELALGGLVQRFAMGGLATQRKVGAAILDPHADQPDDTVKVTVDELNKKFPAFKNLKKGASPVSKLYKATDFQVIRQGLSQSTSTKFQNALNQGLIAGTDLATATLAKDLGTSSKKIDGGSKKNFLSTVRPAIRGDLFEAALLSMNNAGTFDKKQDPGRPFDFPGGLQGGLKDNFPSLPANWVDAKSSYAAASTANMKGKIVRQLVGDLRSSGVESMGINKGGKGKQAAKSADGTTTAAKGGSIQGSSDSVPSLLTPGEFVINKSAAQSIGYSNLSRMNDTGVSRFAAGGVVGFQRFAAGGQPQPGNMMQADLSQFATQAPKAAAMIAQFTESVAMAHSAMLSYQSAISRGTTEGEALNAAANTVENQITMLGSEYQEAIDTNVVLTQEQGALSDEAKGLSQELQHEAAAATQTAAIDKKYKSLRQKGMPAIEARRKAIEEQLKIDGVLLLTKKKLKDSLEQQAKGGGGPSGGGGVGGAIKRAAGQVAPMLNVKNLQKGVNVFARGLGKMQSVLSRVSSGLIGLSFIAGTVVQQMGGLTDAEKEQHQAAIAGTSAFAAVTAEVISFGMQMLVGVANMIASAAMTASMLPARAAELAATIASAGSEGLETASNLAAVGSEAAETGANIGAVLSEGAEIGANELAVVAELADLAATLIATAATALLGVAAVIATVGVLAFGVGAVIATVGVLALGIGAILATVGVLALGVGAVVAAAGMIILGAGALIAGVALVAVAVGAVIAAVALTLAAVAAAALAVTAVVASVALVVLSAGALLASVTLLIAGAAATIAAAALLIVSVAAVVAAVGLALLAVGAVVAAVGMTILGAGALIAGVAMVAVAAGAVIAAVAMGVVAVASVIASVGVALLAAGAVVAAVGMTILAAGSLIAGVALAAVAVGAVIAAVSLGVVAVASVLASVGLSVLAITSLVTSVGLTLLSATSVLAAVTVGALGVSSIVATVAIGLLAVAGVLASVSITALAVTSLAAGAGVLALGVSSAIGVSGILLLGVSALSAAGGLAFFAAALLGGGLFAAIAAIGTALIAMGTVILGVITAAAAEIAASIAVAVTKIGEVIASGAAIIASGLETVASAIVSAAKTVEGLASTIVAAVKSIEVMATIAAVAATISEAIAKAAATIATGLESIASSINAGMKTIEGLASSALAAVKSVEVMATLSSVGATIMETITTFASSAAKSLETLISGAVTAAKSGELAATLANVAADLSAFASKMMGVLADLKSVAASFLLDAAKAGEGLASAVVSAAKAAEGMASSILSGLKAVEGAAGSALAAIKSVEIMETLANVAAMGMELLSTLAATASKWAEAAASSTLVTSKLAEVGAAISKLAMSAIELVSGWAKIAMEAIQNSTIVALIAAKMTEIITTISSVISKIAEVAATIVGIVVTIAKALAEAFGAAMAVLAGGGSLSQAIAAFLAALGLGGVAAASGPVGAGFIAIAIAISPLIIALVALAAIAAVTFAVFAVGFGIGFVTSMYQTIKASTALKQSMERLAKAGDTAIEGLKETGAGSEEEFVDARAGAAVANFNKNLLDTKKFTLAYQQGLKTGGDSVVNFGIMAGLALIPVIGPAIAAGYGLYKVATAGDSLNSVIDESIRAQQALIASEAAQAAQIAKISNLYAMTTWRATKAVIDFDKSLKDAKEAGLNAADTFDIMAGGMAGMLDQLDQGDNRMEEASTRKAELQETLEIKGLVSSTGAVVGEGDTAAEKGDLAEYETIVAQENEARKAQNDLLKQILKQEAALRRQIQNAFGEAISDLAEGTGTANLTDVTSFDDLKAQGDLGAQVAKAVEEINKIIDLEFKAAIKEAKAVGDVELVKALEDKKGARKDVAEAQIEEASMSRLLAEQKANAAILSTEMAERAKQRAIDQVNTTLKGFNNALMGATATADAMAAIDPAIAIANFEGPEAAMFDTEALEQPFSQINPDILNEALEQGIAGITLGIGTNAPAGAPIDTEIEDRAQNIATKIKTVQATIAAIPSSMLASAEAMKIPKGSPEQNELIKKLYKDLDDSVGNALSADVDLGPMVEDRIRKMVREGKPITTDMLQDLIGDLEGIGEAQIEAMIRSIEVQNKFLESMDKINSAIIAQQEKFADALAKVTEVAERAADRMSDAREGGRVSTSADIRANRQRRERGRRTAAGQRLGPAARGAGAIAGDVRATAAALKTLQAEANANATAAKNATDPLEKSKFSDAAKLAAQGAKNAAAELERLSDQSARAADLEKELNQIRKGRKQIGAQVERFAFGSDDERAQQGEEFGDLQLAIGQGGIQGATEDQRANVGSILDALADVENVGGTGKTGRQLKAEFAEKEAIAQGMDPAIAKQIGQAAAAGPREEALLNELAAIGREEVMAAQATAKNTETQIGVLQEIRDKLLTNFVIDINMGQQQAATQDDSSAEAANDQALKDAHDAAVKAVLAVEASWQAADDELKLFQEALADTIKVLTDLQDPEAQRVRREAITAPREAAFAGSDEEAAAQQVFNLSQNFSNAGDDAGDFFDAIETSQNVAGGGEAGGDRIRAAAGSGDDSDIDQNILRESWGWNSSVAGFAEGAGAEGMGDSNTDRIRAALETSLKSTFDYAADKIDMAAPGGAEAMAQLMAAQEATLQSLIKKVKNIQEVAGDEADLEFSEALGPHIAESLNSIFIPAFTSVMEDQAAGGPLGLARGGMVYRADGGSIFQPRGTDTIPAMLTPGEFVIRKSAVDKIGAGNLAALNNGMSVGGVVYRAGGGPAGLPDAGVFTEGFAQSIGQKNPGKVIAALASGYSLSPDEARAAFQNLKILADGGFLDISKIQGPSQLENVMDLIRQRNSGLITSVFGGETTFAAQDFSTMIKGADLGWKEDAIGNVTRTAEGKKAIQSVMTAGKSREMNLRSMYEGVRGTIDKDLGPIGFASKYLKETGVTGKDTLFMLEGLLEDLGMEMIDQEEKNKKTYANWIKSNENKKGMNPAVLASHMAPGMTVPMPVGAAAEDVTTPTADAKTAWDTLTKKIKKQAVKQEKVVKKQKEVEAAQTLEEAKQGMGGGQAAALDALVGAGILRLAKGGSVRHLATGGSTSSVLDKIPAMLTPGEFVMSPEAVQKHGVGFMKRLNSGRAPGFRRGGLVGGGVAYRQAGSTGAEGGGGGMTLSLDSSNIQEVLDNFNATFASTLDNVIVQFSQISAGLDNLAGAMKNGMVMTHNFTGDLALAFKIENADVLKKTIADAIVPKLKDIIVAEIDQKFNKDFRSGQ
jgi:hypothetical protein